MAIEANFPAASLIFAGTDLQLSFSIFGADGVTPINVTGWALEWLLRPKVPFPTGETAVLRKTTAVSPGGISITGAFNADPALNTQRVVVTLTDTDTEAIPPRSYHHALKRLDDGSETILSFGTLHLQVAAAV